MRLYLAVPLVVAFDGATSPVVEDTLEMEPDGDDDDVEVADDCSINGEHGLQVDP